MKQVLQLPHIDSSEVPRYTFDEANNSIRVTVVSGEMPNITILPPGDIRPVYEPQIQYIPVVETKIERIEIPKIVTETVVQKIDVPVIVKEIEYREIEKPVYITEFKEIKVIEIVREKDLVYVDKFSYKTLYIMQAITLGLLVLSHFIK
jgi:hypothetical protein